MDNVFLVIGGALFVGIAVYVIGSIVEKVRKERNASKASGGGTRPGFKEK